LRIQKAGNYIHPGTRLLDIGCADGVIFRRLYRKITYGIGIDPDIEQEYTTDSYKLIKGRFPQDLPTNSGPYDVITLLAVLEHIPVTEHLKLAEDIYNHLNIGGFVIITVPSPRVDKILKILKFIRLIDGMSLEQHYGFDVSMVGHTLTQGGLKFVKHRKFQFGLNNLFLFQKHQDLE